jgi:hypothetical protein
VGTPPTLPLPAAAPPTAAPTQGIAPPTVEPPAATTSGFAPPTVEPPAAPTSVFAAMVEPPAVSATGLPLADPVLSGTVLPGPNHADNEPDDYDGTAGLVYEAPRPAYREPPGPAPSHEPDEPVHNDGLEIFGGVATTEVPDDDVPTREFERRPVAPPIPRPEPGRAPAAGAAWNEPIAPPPVASGGAEDRKPGPFGRILGFRLGGGQPADDGEPRASVRDLPPDVQVRFIRIRFIIVLVVGVVSFILWRYWAVSLTLMILAWVVDAVRRSRSAVLYVNGGVHPGARKATIKQLRKMRRDGYFALDARPIPGSREFIDHLVVGPTGVYAIDSEKWNPSLPIRTWNGKKLYHGPESQKDRLEHAVWEAQQASELLSGALGVDVKVRPALAIYGPKIPWNIATIRNVDVFTGPALGKYFKARARMKDGVPRLTREEVRTIYDTAARLLPDVAEVYTPVG